MQFHATDPKDSNGGNSWDRRLHVSRSGAEIAEFYFGTQMQWLRCIHIKTHKPSDSMSHFLACPADQV
jgi:hypothetical protein